MCELTEGALSVEMPGAVLSLWGEPWLCLSLGRAPVAALVTLNTAAKNTRWSNLSGKKSGNVYQKPKKRGSFPLTQQFNFHVQNDSRGLRYQQKDY